MGFDAVSLHHPTTIGLSTAHVRNEQLTTPRQGLTLVHVSTQLKRILWDRGARGCLGGV